MLAGGRVPEPRRLVLTPGQNPALVPVEDRSRDRTLVLERRPERFAGDRFPEPRRLVVTPGQNPALVPVEDRSPDRILVLERRP